MSKSKNKMRFGITMSPEVFKEVEQVRGLAKRSTFIEWQVAKAFQLDSIRGSLEELCDDLLNKILVLKRIPKEATSVHNIQTMINDARERIEKIKELIETTT